jgi:tRNA1(Val) A37 N6-methylase TrmN6
VEEITLMRGRVRLWQPCKGYRAALDPVLLAAAVRAPVGAHLAEPGLGVGAAALCLLARRPDLRVTGLEIDPGLADLARRNAALNGMEDRLTVVETDAFAADGLFDGLYANPPYHGVAESDPSPLGWKARATVGDPLPWVKLAARLVRGRGRMTIIYRMDRLPDLLAAAAGRFGGLVAVPFWARQGQAAKRVILSGLRNSRAPFSLHPGIVLHADGQTYTPEAQALLSGGEELMWGDTGK